MQCKAQLRVPSLTTLLHPSSPTFASLLAFAALTATLESSAVAQTLQFVDRNSAGAQVGSVGASISHNGRFVAWAGLDGHVYLRDTATNKTSQVDLAWNGAQPNGWSDNYGIRHGASDDGRYVLFSSSAANLLVGGDGNGVADLFMRDRVANTTIRCNVGPGGQEGNGHTTWGTMSADGRYVAFVTPSTNIFPGDGNLGLDVARFDRTTGVSTLVSVNTGLVGAGNGPCFGASMSSSGRYVAFDSSASNLVGNDTNGFVWDAFLRDMNTGTTTIVSRSSTGAQGGLSSGSPAASDDGRYVVFGSNNNFYDGSGIPPIWAPLYVRDCQSGTTTLITSSTADNVVTYPDISANGSMIVFTSLADNLLPGHALGSYDVYRYDRTTATLVRVSTDPLGLGAQGSGSAYAPAISADGRAIAFCDDANNLIVPDLQPGVPDTFLWRDAPFGSAPIVYCTAKVNSLGCTPSIAAIGVPSATSGIGFVVATVNVINNKPGLYLYSNGGQVAVPFLGGLRCVGNPPASPIWRSAAMGSSGNPPPNDCTGTYVMDWNTFSVGGLGGSPQSYLTLPGSVVQVQAWGRDPGYAAPNNATGSDAIQYVVGP